MTQYFYACISTLDQKLARQFDAVQALGIPDERVFSDKLSGKDDNGARKPEEKIEV